MRKAGKKLIPALFAAYILLLCAVFFLREPIGRVRINLVPFDTITTYLTALSENSINTDIVMRGIFGNILLTLPLGAFAAMYAALREKSGKIFLALSLAFDRGDGALAVRVPYGRVRHRHDNAPLCRRRYRLRRDTSHVVAHRARTRGGGTINSRCRQAVGLPSDSLLCFSINSAWFAL